MKKREPLLYEDMAKAARALIEECFVLHRTKFDPTWTGLPDHEFSSRLTASSPGPEGTLEMESIAYHAERDRDMLDVIILVILRLGMEQGIRMVESDLELWKRLAGVTNRGFSKEALETIVSSEAQKVCGRCQQVYSGPSFFKVTDPFDLK